MFGIFTRWATKKSQQIMESREPDFVIGPSDDPYMLRWWAIPRNKWFNIYLHKILHDDDDRALHDHPWRTLSLCTSGQMIEHYLSPNGAYPRKRMIKAGDWIYRGPNFAHRLALPLSTQDEPVTTIFITGPRIREWGFLCAQGWRHWKDFVGAEKGTVGRGCGEVSIVDENGIFNHFHCRECGGGEIQLHNYDGYCLNCVQSSSYKSTPDPDDILTKKRILILGVILCAVFWAGILSLVF